MSQIHKKARKGIQAFNLGDFYVAHEYFEDAWRETPDNTREFYRALLHISGGFFRLTQDRPSAALKFFSRAQHWLSFFSNTHLGVNVAKLRTHLDQLINEINSGKKGMDILERYAFQIGWESQE